MTEQVSRQKAQVDALHAKWQESQQRLAMAQQTLKGAEQEESYHRARLDGAIELAAGGPAGWRWSPEDGVTFTLIPKEIEKPLQAVESAMPTEGPHGTRVKEA